MSKKLIEQIAERIEGVGVPITIEADCPGIDTYIATIGKVTAKGIAERIYELIEQQPSEVDHFIENIRAIRVELAKVKNGNYLFSSTDYERIDKMLYDLQYKTDTPK